MRYPLFHRCHAVWDPFCERLPIEPWVTPSPYPKELQDNMNSRTLTTQKRLLQIDKETRHITYYNSLRALDGTFILPNFIPFHRLNFWASWSVDWSSWRIARGILSSTRCLTTKQRAFEFVFEPWISQQSVIRNSCRSWWTHKRQFL